MNFVDLGIVKDIASAVEKFGIATPTEVQQKAIPYILEKKDVICRSETGSGKTFAFMLPIIQQIDYDANHVQALVLCPTRELAIQVADEAKKVAEQVGVKTCAVFGGSTIDRQVASLKKNPHIVVGTTGRVMDLMKRGALKIQNADFVVLDEADEMLDMGFRPDIESILKHTKKDRTTLMFSATIPEGVEEISNTYQKERVFVEIGMANKALDAIQQFYMFVDRRFKKEALVELFFSDAYGKAIVFTNTKQYADEIAHFLNKNSISCKSIHSDHRQNERRRVLDDFKNGKFDVLVATDVASRGIDIKKIKWIINYDIPHELEFYVHRIGRTARAGESGTVVNIVTTVEQLSKLKEIEKATKASIKPFETVSVNLMSYFVDTKKLANDRNRFKKMNAEKKSRRYGAFEFLEEEDFNYSIKKSFDTKSQKRDKFTKKSENLSLNQTDRKDKSSRDADKRKNAKQYGKEKSKLYNNEDRKDFNAKSRDNVSKSYSKKQNKNNSPTNKKADKWYSKFSKK